MQWNTQRKHNKLKNHYGETNDSNLSFRQFRQGKQNKKDTMLYVRVPYSLECSDWIPYLKKTKKSTSPS